MRRGALSFLEGLAMLSVRDNVAEVLSFTDRLSRQYEFAVASALTDTARTVAQAMPAEVNRVFEGGAVPFTRQAFFFQRADKARLTAVVGIKRLQAEYLAYQVQGGERRPKRQALRLPGDVDKTAQGNLPAGAIARLVARAKSGKRTTKGMAKRYGVSSGLDLFYGEPGDGRPAGIYKRVVISKDRTQLIPVVVFPKVSARYEARFDFYGIARRKALASFEPALVKAWAKAKATAR
jgi:hypothetical protein